MADPTDTPPWLYRAVVGSTWRVVGIVLIVLGGLWVLNQASTLAIMLVVACFLALAMVPGVEALARRFHWKRGAAAGAILIGVFGTLILLIAFLIPALIDMTSKLSADVPQWAEQLNQHGIRVGSGATENSQNVIASIEHWATTSGKSRLVSVAGSSVTILFEFFTVMMFTFLIATNEPRLRNTLLHRMNAKSQKRFLLAWDTAITQTGGYFYSRLLLMIITGSLSVVVMIALGLPVTYALPLAFFGAFFVEFIPVVGSYVGIAIPVLVVLAERGVVPALILLGWGILYQQLHDYLLSPRISSKTMEINAGVAFGSALLGGALAGPLGALFALPAAGMVTIFLRQWLPAYDIDASLPADLVGVEAAEPISKAHRREHQREAEARTPTPPS